MHDVLWGAVEPFRLGLLQRALAEVLLVAIAGAVVGTFVILRGAAFIGESLSHTILPGVAIAYVLGTSLYLGAAAFALLTVLIILVGTRHGGVSTDAAIGVAFAGLFPLGVILLSRQSGTTRNLADLLFGDPLATDATDLLLTAVLVVGAVLLVLVAYRPLVVGSFDPRFAQTLGYRNGLVEAAFLVAVASTVIVSTFAVGNVLSLALLVTPTGAARLVTRRLPSMLGVAIALGMLAGVAALELSYWFGIAAGACIVLCATAELLVALAIRPLVLRRRERPAPGPGVGAPRERLATP